LATEEEWEYACRAGSSTAYYWGDNPADAKNYGWYKDNSNEATHPVGQLKPNKYGLFDMSGHVGEWCAKSDPRGRPVLRGGAFTDEPAKLRSAARMIENDEWNELDPNSPQSVWWLSAADFTGFRVACDEEKPTDAATSAASGDTPRRQ
jgi:sulfatase modifying factor 1